MARSKTPAVQAEQTEEVLETRLDTFNRTLEVTQGTPPHVNQFVRRNPKLAAALAERRTEDAASARGDIQEVSDYLLGKIVDAALADPATVGDEKAAQVRSYLLADEMHRAKVDKLKADTESVLLNVATPTAIRKMCNDFGTCILQGNEKAVTRHLRDAKTEAEADLIRTIGGAIFVAIMDEIKEYGYADDSLARALAAPR